MRCFFSLLLLPAVLACAASPAGADDAPLFAWDPLRLQATEQSPGNSGTTSGEAPEHSAAPDAAPPFADMLPGNPAEGLDPAWEPLLARLQRDGLDKAELRKTFARLGSNAFTPAYMAAKVQELHGVPGIGINRAGQLAPSLPENRPLPPEYLTIGACKALIAEHKTMFETIRETYGVPASDIIAILLVETGLGGNLGDDTALRVLASMASVDTPEKLALGGNSRQPARLNRARLQATLTEKSDWAYNEVVGLLRYAEQLEVDPAGIPSSMFGAVGVCQFMPSNIALHGRDGDGDGKIDLFTLTDACHSVARYLEAAGRRQAVTAQARRAVFFEYNHDNGYAAGVLTAAERIERGLAGKLGDRGDPLAGFYLAGPRALDPSLRGRARYITPRGRVTSLGQYGSLLD